MLSSRQIIKLIEERIKLLSSELKRDFPEEMPLFKCSESELRRYNSLQDCIWELYRLKEKINV